MTGWQSSSETTAEVVGAFVVALGALTDIAKDRSANVGTYSYKYADLASAMELARPTLAANGLAVSQPAVVDGRDVKVSTVVMHTSGEWLCFPPMAMPAGNTAQNTGSAITYARRYALMAILGLATEDDDGANAGRRDEPRYEAPYEPPAWAPDPETVRVFESIKAAKRVNPPAVDDLKAFAAENGRKLTFDALGDPEWRAMVDTALSGFMADPHADEIADAAGDHGQPELGEAS